MTYRDSDALCVPARPPQHAAPISIIRRRRPAGQLRLAGWLCRLISQAVQLLVIVVAWAVGLGLITGSIVLVATVTAPARGTAALKPPPENAASAAQHALQDPARRAAASQSGTARREPSYQVLAAFSGSGNRTTRHFDVDARKGWQLRWTYRCPAQVGAGQFELLRADMAADRATLSTSVNEYATSGRGSASLKTAGHEHYLVVRSPCSWRIKVMQPRSAPRPHKPASRRSDPWSGSA